MIIREDISDNIVFGQTIDSSTVSLDASDTVVFGPATGSPTLSMWNDTIPYREIRIPIGSTLETIMKHFDDPVILNADIVFQRITPSGEIENGNGVGVTRDLITEFWTEFYERCTSGSEFKIPFLRHEFQENQCQTDSWCLGGTSANICRCKLHHLSLKKHFFHI